MGRREQVKNARLTHPLKSHYDKLNLPLSNKLGSILPTQKSLKQISLLLNKLKRKFKQGVEQLIDEFQTEIKILLTN